MRSRFFQAIRGVALAIAAATASLSWVPAYADSGHGLEGGVQPADAPAPRRIGLAEAIRLGATEGPGLAVAKAPRSALAEAGRAADALFPLLPRATAAVGERRGPLGAGIEVSVSVLQDLSLGGLGGARRDTAAALARLTEADVARARLDGAARAALSWIGLIEADRVLALRQEGLAQAEALLRAVRARVGTGVSEPLELALAQGEGAAARAAVLDAEGLRFEAGMELAFAVGQPPAPPIAAEGDLGEPGAIAPGKEGEAEIRQAAIAHPAAQVAEARREVADREGRLAAAILSPTLGVGASFVREGTGDRIWSGIVSIPLPFGRPGAFDGARGRAAADAAQAHAEATRAELEQTIRIADHDREHTREVHAALDGGALAPMREAVRLARAQLDAGTTDVTHVLLAQQRLRTVEEQVTRSLAEVRRADIRWMRAAGTLLSTGAL
jgi:outer membrane protein TolC